METGGSLPHSQQPAISPCSEPDQSSLCFPPQFLKMKFQLTLSLPGPPFPQFPHKNPVFTPSPPSIRATFPAHLIRLDFITQIVFGGEYKARTSSFNIFSHSPVTSSFICSNITVLHILIFVFLDHNLEDKRFCTE